MKFTIREIKAGVATVDFEDGAWAEVPMEATETEEEFINKASGYATKTFVAPEWSNAEASIDGATIERTIPEPVESTEIDGVPLLERGKDSLGSETTVSTPPWLLARLEAYGTPRSQLEFITENGLEAWQEEVAAIKKANPIV
tara:strand:- start:28 stop:456 length:429 start_codon:yes stop_codon:yes gene_type:complete